MRDYVFPSSDHEAHFYRVLGRCSSPDVLAQQFASLTLEQQVMAADEISDRVSAVHWYEGDRMDPEGLRLKEDAIRDVLGAFRVREAPEVEIYSTSQFKQRRVTEPSGSLPCYFRSPSGREFGVYPALVGFRGRSQFEPSPTFLGSRPVETPPLPPPSGNGAPFEPKVGTIDSDGGPNHYRSWRVIALDDPTVTMGFIRKYSPDGYKVWDQTTHGPLRFQYWDVTPRGALREKLAAALYDIVAVRG